MSDKADEAGRDSADAIRRRRQQAEEAAAQASAVSDANDANDLSQTETDDDAAANASGAPRRRVFDPGTGAADDDAARASKGGRGASSRAARKSAREADLGGAGAGEQEDFAALFEESMRGAPRGRAAAGADHASHLEPGQQVTGTVIQIGSDNVFVDLGGKTEAFIPRDELLDANGELTLAEGDSVTARVVGFDRGGQIRLATRGGGNVAVEDAYAAGVPVSGRVTGVNKGGFEVEIMGQRGFCPISQIDLHYTEDPQVHVGQTYEFKIKEYAENGRRLVVSRAEHLRDQAKLRADALRDKLEVGAILEGQVRSLQDYGAFIDLGGLDGLVHVSEISHSRVDKPSEALQVGQTVKVKVLSIEHGKKGERIALSIKAAQDDPWETADEWLAEGSRLTGRVVRLAPFGAFVELQPGIEGLLHVSEMSWEKHVRNPREIMAEGDTLEVQILSVDRETRRVSLSLKATLGDPWVGVAERYAIDSEVTGTVERLAEFGVFVKLEPGVVALIPMSELGTRPGVPAARDFAVGQEVSARVLAVDEERRRLTLSRKEAGEVVALSRGVQRRRSDGDEAAPAAPAGGGGRRPGRGGPGGKRRDDDRAVAGNPTSYREAGGTFATLGDLLRQKGGRKEES